MKKKIIALLIFIFIFTGGFGKDAHAAAIELYSTSLYSDANLVAYYRLEDANDSKSTYNLTNTGTVTFTSALFNNGANFSNTNGKRLSTTSFWGLSYNSSFSISCWIKVASETTGDDDIWGINYNTGSNEAQYRLLYEYNGGTRRLRFYRNGSSATFVDINGDIAGSWVHLVLTYNGSTGAINLYKNAGSPATGTNTGTGSISGDANASIGGTTMASYNSPLNGLVDDFAVFNRVLTATEVDNLYTGNWPSASSPSVANIILFE